MQKHPGGDRSLSDLGIDSGDMLRSCDGGSRLRVRSVAAGDLGRS